MPHPESPLLRVIRALWRRGPGAPLFAIVLTLGLVLGDASPIVVGALPVAAKKHERDQHRTKTRPQDGQRVRGRDGGKVTTVPVPKRNTDPDPLIQDRYIVVLREDGGNLRAAGKGVNVAAAARSLSSGHQLQIGRVYSLAIAGFSATIPPEELAAVAADPRVAGVVPVTRDRFATHTPISPFVPDGIDRIGADLNHVASIDGVDNAFPRFPSNGPTVDVAVIDSGVGPDPDLNLAGGIDATFSSGAPECRITNGNFDDVDSHGTTVARIIGARDNGVGAVGVAPGVNIWAVRVFDADGPDADTEPENSGEWTLCGLEWVLAHADQIDVVNMSLGHRGSDSSNCGRRSLAPFIVTDPLHLAICRVVQAGVTVVVAAGNDCDNAAKEQPASYDEVITVSALADYDGRPGGFASKQQEDCRRDNDGDGIKETVVRSLQDQPDDSLTIFSNFGSEVDIAAPGLGGTSFAAPHVAGAAAIVLLNASRPNRSPSAVKQALLSSREVGKILGDTDGRDEGVLKLGPSSLLDLRSLGGSVAGTVSFTVQGLQPSERLTTLRWFNGATPTTLAITPTTVVAAANGTTGAVTFKVPTSVGGNHKVEVIGNNLSAASATFVVRPSVASSRSSAGRGQSFTATLRGFAGTKAYVLALQTAAGKRTTLKPVTTDATGSVVNAALKVPTTQATGAYKLVILERKITNPKTHEFEYVKIAETPFTVSAATAQAKTASNAEATTDPSQPTADPEATSVDEPESSAADQADNSRGRNQQDKHDKPQGKGKDQGKHGTHRGDKDHQRAQGKAANDRRHRH